MNAAELRACAIALLTPKYAAPTPEKVARAAVWAQLAVSAAVSETNTAADVVAAVREYAETGDDDGIRTRGHVLDIVGQTPASGQTR